jgi:hypothetical protein
MTLVRDGDLGVPMEDIYATEIDVCRQQGRQLAEVSCLADRRHDLERSLPLVIRIMGLMAQCAVHRGIDTLAIAVHPRHARFYERFGGFRFIGEEKVYEKVCDKPAVALAVDLSRVSIDHPRAYERFFGAPFAEEHLAYREIPKALLDRMRPIVEANFGPISTPSVPVLPPTQLVTGASETSIG